MKLGDYDGKLSDYSEDVQKEILKKFVNQLILDLNARLTEEEAEHIKNRVFSSLNSDISISLLVRIKNEIIGNYKKYIPFCFASIFTAQQIVSK